MPHFVPQPLAQAPTFHAFDAAHAQLRSGIWGTSCEQEGVPEQGTAEEITSAGALPAGVILFAL